MKKRKTYDFTSLVPASILALTSHKPLNRLKLPISHKENMGVLYVDVTNFTKFTETVSSTDYYGVEKITGLLNRYYEVVVNIISYFQGEVVKYGGDSCLSIFRGKERDVIENLLACRKMILEQVQKFGKKYSKSQITDLKVHGSLAFGEASFYIIGSVKEGMNYFVGGDAVRKAYELNSRASAGEIVIDNAILNKYRKDSSRIKIPNSIPDYVPPKQVLQSLNERAQLFVPEAIRTKLANKSIKAELRNAIIIFLNISGSEDGNIISASQYQEIYNILQYRVGELGGSINKIDYSDKGYVVIITFGIPISYPDNIERAFLCAWRINQTPTELKLSTGITECTIYAGIIGAQKYCEYGIIGNGVNIAARLMDSAAPGEIIITESIVSRIEKRFEVSFIKEISVKGIQDKIKMYRLVGELPENWFAMQQNYERHPVLAREKIIASLSAQLKTKKRKLIAVYGLSGFGKSYMVYQLGHPYVQKNKEIFYYSSDQITNKRRLEFFFLIIKRYLGIVQPAKELDKLLDWCALNNIHAEAELLKKWLIHSQQAPNELYAKADVITEYELFFNILSQILYRILHTMELIIIENLEFLDADSGKLLNILLPNLYYSNNKIIITCQKSGSDIKLEKLQPISVELVPFTISETHKIAKFFLPNITKKAVSLIYQMTEGNPLFIRELCYVLRDLMTDKNDLLTEAILIEMEHRHLLPESLENLFIRIYDNLPENSKKVIKLAAIITKSFTFEDIAQLLPKPVHKELHLILDELARLRLLMIKTIDPQTEYIFPNNIVREAIYKTILLSEKKQLHRFIAIKMIDRLSHQIGDYFEIIAEHFIKAQDNSNIAKWALQAGLKLLNLSEYDRSIYYLKYASDNAEDASKLKEIKIALAEAYIFQNRNKEARKLLDSLSYLEKDLQPLSDRYLWLCSRFMIATYDIDSAQKKLKKWLPLIQNKQYADLIKTDILETMLSSKDRNKFEKTALQYYNELESAGNKAILNKVSSIIGRFYLDQCSYKKAQQFYKIRLDLSTKLKDLVGQRLSLSSLGVIYSRLGDKKAAVRYYNKALTIAEHLGDRNGYSKILLNLGAIYRNDAKYNEAMDCYLKSLKLTEVTQNRLHYATTLYNIGELNFYLQEYHVALDYFKQSIAVSKEIGDEVGISYCNDARGDILFKMKRYDEAEALYRKNLKLQEKLNDMEGVGHTIGNLGNIGKETHDYDKAIKYYTKQLDIVTKIGDKNDMGRALFNMATVSHEQGFISDALQKYNAALKLFKECNAQYYIDTTQKQIRALRALEQQDKEHPTAD